MNMRAFEKKPVEAVKTAAEARDLAIDWQHWQSDYSMSLCEVLDWQDYFGQLVNKFPELQDEFTENAIPY